MMAQEPIPYELADPADQVGHGEHPVDSTTRPCCGGIGGHAQSCRSANDRHSAHQLLDDAAKYARYAAENVADALITAPSALDEREVRDVAAVLLAAENAVRRLGEAVS